MRVSSLCRISHVEELREARRRGLGKFVAECKDHLAVPDLLLVVADRVRASEPCQHSPEVAEEPLPHVVVVHGEWIASSTGHRFDQIPLGGLLHRAETTRVPIETAWFSATPGALWSVVAVVAPGRPVPARAERRHGERGPGAGDLIRKKNLNLSELSLGVRCCPTVSAGDRDTGIRRRIGVFERDTRAPGCGPWTPNLEDAAAKVCVAMWWCRHPVA